MKRMVLKTPAKINLALDVVGKRADGYHTLETVFQTVSLYDTITVTCSHRTENKPFGFSAIFRGFQKMNGTLHGKR